MRNPMRRAYKYLMAQVQYMRARRLADRLHEENGERYYVISTVGRRLVVGNRIDLRMSDYRYRKAKGMERKTRPLTVTQIEKACFYCTPYRDEVHGRLSVADRNTKKKAFIEYALK